MCLLLFNYMDVYWRALKAINEQALQPLKPSDLFRVKSRLRYNVWMKTSKTDTQCQWHFWMESMISCKPICDELLIQTSSLSMCHIITGYAARKFPVESEWKRKGLKPTHFTHPPTTLTINNEWPSGRRWCHYCARLD